MSAYNTNLAAEFYVLSTLHRLGVDANLTLGNKKSVDISVVRGRGDALTIDVKGLAARTGWPVDNLRAGTKRHYIVFVCYRGKIDQPEVSPLVWIVPSLKLQPLIYNAPGGRKLVTLAKLITFGAAYENAWSQLV